MSTRRIFLKSAGALTILSPLLSRARPSSPLDETPQTSSTPGIGFKPHWLKQADGRGGWILRPAEIQFLPPDGKVPYYDRVGGGIKPFGLAQMDNGEVIMLASIHDGTKGEKAEKPVVAFSRDGGRTWTEFKRIDEADDVYGRPMILTYLGKGSLYFEASVRGQITRFFSGDYGRTWPERRPFQPAANRGSWGGVEGFFGVEGNALVERDVSGVATRIAEIGYNLEKGTKWPEDPTIGILRWSTDSGRTWTNETTPKVWRWQVQYKGKTFTRGISEGSLLRAANGWLVAALRTDAPPEFIQYRNDNLEGVGISISRDDGATWSPIQILYDAGRMHTHLLRMPNGDTVMTHIMRQDIQKGELVSYRRGCGAVISRDNGLTWDMAHRYLLDDFEFADGTPFSLACGHLYSTLLDDGHILTCYGHYPAKAACAIRWKPTPA